MAIQQNKKAPVKLVIQDKNELESGSIQPNKSEAESLLVYFPYSL